MIGLAFHLLGLGVERTRRVGWGHRRLEPGWISASELSGFQAPYEAASCFDFCAKRNQPFLWHIDELEAKKGIRQHKKLAHFFWLRRHMFIII